MIKSNLFDEAKKFAIMKHLGQKRKDGSPYVEHPIRVAEIVLRFKESHKIEELAIAALLHDTLEDTDTGIPEIRKKFGELVALLVVELTTDKFACKALGKAEYLSTKLSNEKTLDSWALVIKLADRLDNVSDLATADINFARKYKQETIEILKTIEEKRKLSATHKSLIKAIWEKLEEAKI